ncbi:MAG: FG-GAP-like repeat-containing protein [Polyangiaceae bacterium]|nr:FG-GAP-like repeat-containing protein [Polyangiaceae bacterium]
MPLGDQACRTSNPTCNFGGTLVESGKQACVPDAQWPGFMRSLTCIAPTGCPPLPPPNLTPVNVNFAIPLPGKLDGRALVSKDGAFQYEIPLRAPKGRLDLQPDLRLVYNSRGGDGLAGVGWSLDGLPSISRCRKSVASDGISERVRYDSTDSYCLNGQKLNEVDLLEYRTQQADYSRVRAEGGVRSDGSPRRFRIETKDGRILTLGGTDDSTGTAVLGGDNDSDSPVSPAAFAEGNGLKLRDTDSVNQGARVVRSWHVSRIEDRAGNWIDFKYVLGGVGDGGVGSASRLPSSINYPTGSMSFSYDLKPDRLPMFEGGVNVSIDYRLREVSALGYATDQSPAQTKLWSYRLLYKQSESTGRSLLEAAAFCTGRKYSDDSDLSDNQCLEPTRFTYDDAVGEFEVVDLGAMPLFPLWFEFTRLITTDLNGDGRTDLVYAGSEPPPNEKWHLFVQIANPAGNPAPYAPPVDVSNVVPSPIFGEYGLNVHRSRTVDLNGDGADELVLALFDGTEYIVNHAGRYDRFSVFSWNGSGLTRVADIPSTPGKLHQPFTFADMNADGLPDLMRTRLDSDVDRDRWEYHQNRLAGCNFQQLDSRCQTEISNLLSQTQQSEYWYYEPGDSSGLPSIARFVGGVSSQGVDLMNDGRTDIFAMPSQGYGWFVSLTRHGQSLAHQQFDSRTSRISVKEMAGFADLNGDGLLDPASRTWEQAPLLLTADLNTGAGIGPAYNWPIASTVTGIHKDTKDSHRLVDFNGDGRADLLIPPYHSAAKYGGYTGLVTSFGGPPALFLNRGSLGRTAVNLPSTDVFRLQHNEVVSGGVILATRRGFAGTTTGDSDGNGIPEIFQVVHPKQFSYQMVEIHGVGIFGTPMTRPTTADPWSDATETPRIQMLRSVRKVVPDKLTQVVDGGHRTDTASYLPISDPSVYTPGTDCLYPQRCMKTGMDVVANHRAYASLNASEPNYDLSYRYEDARADVLGRGFVGFGRMYQTDRLSGAVTTDRFRNDLAVAMCPGHVYPFAGQSVETNVETPLPSGLTRRTRTERRFCARKLDYSRRSSSLSYTPGFPRPSTWLTDEEIRRMKYYDHEPWGTGVSGPALNFCDIDSQALSNIAETQATCSDLREASFTTELVESKELTEQVGAPPSSGLSQQETLYYDLFGNTVGRIVARASTSPTQISEVRSETTTYAKDPANWLLGRVSSVTVTSTVGSKVGTRQTTYDYEGTVPWPKTIHIQAGGPVAEALDVGIIRNAFGMISEVTERSPVAGSPFAPRTTKVYYDALGVYPNRIVNAENHVTRLKYDPGFGVLLETTPPNNQTTKWTLDDFGRQTSTIYPDGYQTIRTFPGPASGPLTVSESANTGEVRTLIFDGFERVTGEQWKHFDGSMVSVSTTFRDKDRETVRTLPAKVGTLAEQVKFKADALGRPLLLTNADGSARRWEYPNLMETREIDEEGKERRLIFDSAGRVRQNVSLRPPSAPVTTTYDYGAFGVLATLTDPLGTLTSISVDGLGRTTLLSNPNTGTRTFAYSPFGETSNLSTPTDSVDYWYDRVGRVTRATELERPGAGATDRTRLLNFTYDTCLSGALCTTQASDLNGAPQVKVTYVYDAFGRVQQKKMTLSGDVREYGSEYAYDGFGRLSDQWVYSKLQASTQTELSSGLGYTYKNGYLQTVYDRHWFVGSGGVYYAPHYQALEYDVDGQVARETFGNGLAAQRRYDPKSRRLNFVDLKDPLGRVLDQRQFDYYANGNLRGSQRTVVGPTGLPQTSLDALTYDALDRLSSWNRSLPGGAVKQNQTYTYRDDGSFESMTEQGGASLQRYFDYDPARKQILRNMTETANGVSSLVEVQSDLSGRATATPSGATNATTSMPEFWSKVDYMLRAKLPS